MTKKEKFINFIQQEIFDKENIYEVHDDWTDIQSFWGDFVNQKNIISGDLTENGAKVLKYMQENYQKCNNNFKSKEIGEGLFVSSRSVSGSMKKLITEGYVNKIGSDPVTYEISQKGIDKNLN